MIHTFLILAALVVSGVGFARLTQKETVEPMVQPTDNSGESAAALRKARIHITYSSLPTGMTLLAGERSLKFAPDSNGGYVADADLAANERVIFLQVGWPSVQPGQLGQNFVKLVIEAEGEKTFTHVFDSPGNIDDFVELPF